MSDSEFYLKDVGSGEENVKEDKENNFASPNNTNTVCNKDTQVKILFTFNNR